MNISLGKVASFELQIFVFVPACFKEQLKKIPKIFGTFLGL